MVDLPQPSHPARPAATIPLISQPRRRRVRRSNPHSASRTLTVPIPRFPPLAVCVRRPLVRAAPSSRPASANVHTIGRRGVRRFYPSSSASTVESRARPEDAKARSVFHRLSPPGFLHIEVLEAQNSFLDRPAAVRDNSVEMLPNDLRLATSGYTSATTSRCRVPWSVANGAPSIKITPLDSTAGP